MEDRNAINFNVYGERSRKLVEAVVKLVAKDAPLAMYFIGFHLSTDDEVYGLRRVSAVDFDFEAEDIFRWICEFIKDEGMKIVHLISLEGFDEPVDARELQCLAGILKHKSDSDLIAEFGEEIFFKVKGMPADPFTKAKNEIVADRLRLLYDKAGLRVEDWCRKSSLAYVRKRYVDDLKLMVFDLLVDAAELGRSFTDEQVK